MTVLALRHRPHRFAELVGQAATAAILKAMVRADDPPPALLFRGSHGTGKTTTARVLAAALNCSEPQDGDACGSCPTCIDVQTGRASFVLEIDGASNGGVDEVRRIREQCSYSHAGDWRVIILDEAQAMSRPAFNALLKVLEEPPTRTVFVLVTTEPEKILPTVRSRAMPFDFRRIREIDVVTRLASISESEGIEAADDLHTVIAKHANGGLRDAIMLLDQSARAEIHTGDEFVEFFGLYDYSSPFFWAALRGDHAEGFKVIDQQFSRAAEAEGLVAGLTHLVSDLLVIKSGGKVLGSDSEIAERVEIGSLITTEQCVQVIEVLWDLRTRIQDSETDQRSSMEMAFVLISNVVKGAAPAPKAAPKPAFESIVTPVTFEDVQAALR